MFPTACVEEIFLPFAENLKQDIKEEPPELELQVHDVYSIAHETETESYGQKLGEIFKLTDNNWQLVCTQCLEEFNQFDAFTVHVEEHLQQVLDERIDPKIEVEEMQFDEGHLSDAGGSEESYLDNLRDQIIMANKHRCASSDFVIDKRGRKRYPCPECGRNFNKNQNRNLHLNSIHINSRKRRTNKRKTSERDKMEVDESSRQDGDSQIETLDESVSDRYPCPKCGVVYKTMGNLKRHLLLLHRNGKENASDIVRCPKCNKISSSVSNLRRHLLSVHNIEYRLKCEVCGMQFNRKWDFNNHCALAHRPRKTQEQLNVPETDEGENQSETVKFDENASEGFSCSECNALLSNFQNLKRHLLSVHNIEHLFKCEDCGMEFNKKWDLNSHSVEVHKKKIIERQINMPDLKDEEDQLETVKDDKSTCEGVRCPDCKAYFSSFGNLKRHVFSIHNKEYLYKCEDCGMEFNRKWDLNSHCWEIHKKSTKERQTSVSDTDDEEDQLETVKYDKSTTDAVRCPECNVLMSNLYNLKRHVLSVHNKEYLYKCEDCGMEFNRKWDLNTHCAQIHRQRIVEDQLCNPEEEYQMEDLADVVRCPYCNAFFSNVGNLKRHVSSIHNKEYLFRCEDCGMEFNRKYDLNSHCNAVHKASIINDPNDSTQMESMSDGLRCPECNVFASTIGNLKRHMLSIHNKEYFFKCEDCDMEFNRKCELKTHINVFHRPMIIEIQANNSEETDTWGSPSDGLRCPECNTLSSSVANLRRHLKTLHNKEYFFKCEDCGMEFNRKYDLNIHCTVVHNPMITENQSNNSEEGDQMERTSDRLRCPECNVFSSSPANLKRHVLYVHKKDFFFKCEECGMEFSRKWDLNAHCALAHKPKMIETQFNMPGTEDGESQMEMVSFDESTSEEIRCPVCNAFSSSFGNLKRHFLAVHKKEFFFQCEDCGMKFNKKRKLTTHRAVAHGLGAMENQVNIHEEISQLEISQLRGSTVRVHCPEPECKAYFRYIENLKRHVLFVHEKEYALKCELCDMEFIKRCELNAHYEHYHKRITMVKQMEFVKEGSKLFNDVMDEIVKFDQGTTDGHTCPECNTHMSTYGNLKQHVLSVHNKEYFYDVHRPKRMKMQPESENVDFKFSCPECGFGANSTNALRSHMKEHSVDKIYGCKLCNTKYAYWEFLYLHLTYDHNLKRIQTKDMCDIVVRGEEDKEREQTRRNCEIKYECYMCRKPFNDVKLMKDHFNQHWKPLHSCKICGAEFKHQFNWRVHLNLHLP